MTIMTGMVISSMKMILLILMSMKTLLISIPLMIMKLTIMMNITIIAEMITGL